MNCRCRGLVAGEGAVGMERGGAAALWTLSGQMLLGMLLDGKRGAAVWGGEGEENAGRMRCHGLGERGALPALRA